jgi:hypothetical protein
VVDRFAADDIGLHTLGPERQGGCLLYQDAIAFPQGFEAAEGLREVSNRVSEPSPTCAATIHTVEKPRAI